ncbi:hypothetical protein CC80DRAFT_404468 [Byssothecium circinans]|uniref:BZIP domain-containing protein n=1 Tax=Byssothecium circinans TaxID=147558 RepID=A0A6A5U7N1_9PLEO|nr:hypothetical protein CC80DRAFT_404468 [Byssothecium circinans]
MSSYNGRRGPNVSEYIANLNTIPSPQDQTIDPANLDDDFALFTNTDFNDTGSFPIDLPLDLNFGVDSQQNSEADPTNTNASGTGDSKMEFGLPGDFQFADFSNFSNPIIDTSISNLQHPQPSNFPVAPNYTSSVSSAISPVVPGFDASIGKKRKLENGEASSQQSIDEAARVAAEEDKRRRNTAASARFRIKKKQREQTLEKTAKEMSERVSVLETRIQQLETENTWLKGLITEKNGGKASTQELMTRLSKHERSNSDRSTGTRTDGVGTKA